MKTSMAWLDLMMTFQRQMQRASLQSLSSYSPATDTRIIGRVPQQQTTGSLQQVVPVGEERLNVATRTVQGETTRIRRRVVAQPVEQDVTLREERVVIERRRPTNAEPRPDVLTETVIEMSDTRQVPTVWKSLHVAEEVVLRKEVTERTEKVRETVRRDVVEVEHAHETQPQALAEIQGRVAEAVREQAREQVVALRHAAEEESHDKPAEKKPQVPAVQPPGRKG